MDIQHIESDSKGYFKAMDTGDEAGRMTYSKAGADKIIIDHTEVGDIYGGKGVGKQMLMAAVNHARESGLKIVPLCPFAKKMFDKMEDIRDVLA